MDPETKAQVDAFIQKMKEKSTKVHTNTTKAVTKACLVVERAAKESMYKTEHDASKVYKRGTKVHLASEDFSAPAVDTGRLVQSITHNVQYGANGAEGYVGTNVKYGIFLENGTSRMAPRPWLKRAVAGTRDKVKEIMNGIVNG